MEMVALDNKPFSVVEDEGICRLVHVLTRLFNPTFNLKTQRGPSPGCPTTKPAEWGDRSPGLNMSVSALLKMTTLVTPLVKLHR